MLVLFIFRLLMGFGWDTGSACNWLSGLEVSGCVMQLLLGPGEGKIGGMESPATC